MSHITNLPAEKITIQNLEDARQFIVRQHLEWDWDYIGDGSGSKEGLAQRLYDHRELVADGQFLEVIDGYIEHLGADPRDFRLNLDLE